MQNRQAGSHYAAGFFMSAFYDCFLLTTLGDCSRVRFYLGQGPGTLSPYIPEYRANFRSFWPKWSKALERCHHTFPDIVPIFRRFGRNGLKPWNVVTIHFRTSCQFSGVLTEMSQGTGIISAVFSLGNEMNNMIEFNSYG